MGRWTVMFETPIKKNFLKALSRHFESCVYYYMLLCSLASWKNLDGKIGGELGKMFKWGIVFLTSRSTHGQSINPHKLKAAPSFYVCEVPPIWFPIMAYDGHQRGI